VKEILLYTLRTGAGEAEIGAEQCGAICSKQWDFWSRICMKGARFQRERERERDHELFEYGVLVTHVFKVRDFRKRETMARWTVFFSRTRSACMARFTKEKDYGPWKTCCSGRTCSSDIVDFREKDIICHL
jgi:hypothetical protein